jgi:glutathione S-transferase
MKLQEGPFINGTHPGYADYLAFGGFQWARLSSPFQLLAEDDLVYAWRERCLDLFAGLARRESEAS